MWMKILQKISCLTDSFTCPWPTLVGLVKSSTKIVCWDLDFYNTVFIQMCYCFVQDCSISIANAMQILQSYTKPSI